MMFLEKAKRRVEMPPKPAIHTNGDAFLHAMPAFIPKIKSAGMKWVGGYPENYKRGLPYITGLLVLNDMETGVPMPSWTAPDNGGAHGGGTALTAKYLARQGSNTLAILGVVFRGTTI